MRKPIPIGMLFKIVNLIRKTIHLAGAALLILAMEDLATSAETGVTHNASTPGKKLKPLPSLDEALNSREDVWGLAAMRQTNGPSYEFFKDLLPPLRYVNAAFRYYPIILSGPGSAQKARLV